MLKKAVNTYLAVRRAAGFKLQNDELYLDSFARFATDHGDTHVVTKTAIAWARKACSEPQRAIRLKVIIRFAHFSRADDNRHEIPPQDIFCARRQRPIPYIYGDEDIQGLLDEALRLGPVGSIRPHI